MPYYRGSDDEVVWLDEPVRRVPNHIGARPLTSDDGVTGAMSRGGISELAYCDLTQATHTGERLSCAVLAIDEFASIAKSHGQCVGELLLKQAASTCGLILRGAGYIAGISDEEFVIIFPRTSLVSAFAVADSIREKIAAATFEIAEQQIRLSVSIGVSEFNFPESGFDGLVSDAKAALLEAKMDGKNQVACYFGDVRIRSNNLPEECQQMPSNPIE